MKRLISLMCAGIAAFALVLSCDEPKLPVDGDGEGWKPEGPGMENHPALPTFEDFPLMCSSLYAEENEAGVTIEVKAIYDDNFVFELRPGALVQSYRLDVYPLARLYNNLLDDGMAGSDAVDIAAKIRTYLLDGTGSGGFEFSVNDDPEGFLQKEFDWMNTSYAGAAAVAIPDCDFVIAVLSSVETTVTEISQEHLTLCHLHTTSQPLIGDPMMEIDVTTGYTAFTVNHIPSVDAFGYYYLGSDTASIDAYLDAFGDVMLRDFVRTLYHTPMDVSDPEQLYYTNGGYEAGTGSALTVTTIAVAVDENLTPQEDFTRHDFTLLDVPEQTKEADATFDILEDRVGAAYFEYEIEFNDACGTIFYRIYTKEQKEAFESGTKANRIKERLDMIQNGSYGCHNPIHDVNNPGTEPRVRDCWVANYRDDFEPGSEVYIGYFCRNLTMQFSDMKFTEPIYLDERNFTSPVDCKVKDLNLVVRDPGRQKFTVDVTYDPATVSMLHIQTMLPAYVPAQIPQVGSDWTHWVDFIFHWWWDSAEYPVQYNTADFTANVMCWMNEPSGRDGWTFTGMVPGEEYLIYCCAEDFDGNISEVKLATVRTQDVQVGPDPTVSMELITAPGGFGDWCVQCTIEKDTEYFLAAWFDNFDAISRWMPDGYNQSQFNNIFNPELSGVSYDDWYDALYEWCACGFEEDKGGGFKFESDGYLTDWDGDKLVVAVVIAVGRNEDGSPKHEMFSLICKDGVAKSLEEIYNMTE